MDAKEGVEDEGGVGITGVGTGGEGEGLVFLVRATMAARFSSAGAVGTTGSGTTSSTFFCGFFFGSSFTTGAVGGAAVVVVDFFFFPFPLFLEEPSSYDPDFDEPDVGEVEEDFVRKITAPMKEAAKITSQRVVREIERVGDIAGWSVNWR